MKRGYLKSDFEFLKTIGLMVELPPNIYSLQFGETINPYRRKNRLLKSGMIKCSRYYDKYNMLRLDTKAYSILSQKGYSFFKPTELNMSKEAIERRIALARAVAMLYRAGVSIFPQDYGGVRPMQSKKAVENGQSIFMRSYDIKHYLHNDSVNQEIADEVKVFQAGAKYAGILDSPNGTYAIYSTNSNRPGWQSKSEMTARATMFYWFSEPEITKAILFTPEANTFSTIFTTERNSRKRFIKPTGKMNSTERKAIEKSPVELITPQTFYDSLSVLPADPFGARILRIMLYPGWRAKVMDFIDGWEGISKRPHGQMYVSEGMQYSSIPVINLIDLDITKLYIANEIRKSLSIEKITILWPTCEGWEQTITQIDQLTVGWANVLPLYLEDIEDYLGISKMKIGRPKPIKRKRGRKSNEIK